MLKKNYIEVEVELVCLHSADVITASVEETDVQWQEGWNDLLLGN